MPRTAVKALGEIALRVNDLPAMRRFYTETFGLEEIGTFEHIAFFKLADGYAGHTAILALFDRDVEVDARRGTVDHIAFTISLGDYDSEKERLEALGMEVTTAVHDWVQWRSIYVRDPEGNQVELVCFDPSREKPE
jgi:catechol 2,3-dioxygenase-like lactoylglutathione lyase family enzyme